MKIAAFVVAAYAAIIGAIIWAATLADNHIYS